MAEIPVSLEVERVVNLIRGFGWEKKSEQVEDGKVRLVIEKSLRIESPGTPG